jgi:hypothetical protein
VFSVADPGFGIFLTPESRIRIREGKKSGFGIRDEHPGTFFREFINRFLGLKYLNADPDPEIWIRIRT